MNKALIRPCENAYPRPPFFHLSHRTDWTIPYYFACALLLTLGSAFVYGYGVLVHALAMQTAGMLFVPALSFFKKSLFYHSLLWSADLLILGILLPVSLPWYMGFVSAPFFILGARLFMSPETKPLFQPHALILVLLLNAGLFQNITVFHIMPEMSFFSWHEASFALFFGKYAPPVRDVSFLVGGSGGSIALVLFTGIILSAVKAVNFSLTIIYVAVFGLAVLFLGIPPNESPLRTSEILFIGIFLLQNPAPLEYRRKLIYAFLAASLGCLLLSLGIDFPLFMGVLAANLFTPLMDILPQKNLKDKNQKHPPGAIDALLTGTLSLTLAGIGYFLVRLS